MPNYVQIARQAARGAGIDPNAFVRQIGAESSFNPNARSGAGAIGIAQIEPATAKSWGVNPNDPVAALRAAAIHMAIYQKQTGSLKGALEDYNLGHVAPDSQLPAETRNYIRKIIGGQTVATPTSKAVHNALQPAQVAASPGVDRAQIALGLLGFGSGGNDSSDPLSMALQAAQNSQVQASSKNNVREASPQSQRTAPSANRLAPQVEKALAFARANGWKGQVTSGYRTYAQQQTLYQRYLAGGNIAAKPGQSNHESGQAVDVTDIPGFLRAMAKAPPSIRLYNRVPGDSLHFSVTGH